VQTCPTCGEENPARARFCLACGTALGAPAAAAEERKVVSVLFVDLVGFTAGADQADPEDVRATLRPYHARASREIERFGGTVEKFVGDAVMAVFGAPVAHEDDPERAVRAALRILDAIKELNEQEMLDLAVRAGVATGEAVVSLSARPGTGEGIATGDVVNTAARLQSEAPTGGLVVNEQTMRATQNVIDYIELPSVSVKGKADPLPLWQGIGARSRFGVDTDRVGAGAFVGRERELQLLQSTYERMVGESEIQLVTVTGEPGVGKTRLLAELRQWIDDRPEFVVWRQGRCLPYGDGITFWALGEIVKAHAGILESDGPAEAASKLRGAVEAMEDARWLEDRLRPLIGLTAEEAVEQEESYAAWERFLEEIAADGPLVLLVEDLHWADPALLAFLERLVDWSTGLPILVVCTGRPELYERHPTWGGGTRNSTTVSLSPLSARETTELVLDLLETAVLPAETTGALVERSGGNPLYTEEFVRLFREAETTDLPMPDSVHGIIAARLDTLQSDRKTLLQDAAVIGKVFWAGALAAMAGRDREAVREALHQLSRKELVRPARTSSVAGEAEFVFWHALVRDVAYGQIPRAQRAAKHHAAASWIESMAGERLADHADLLAYHLTESIALARAVGDEPDPELRQRAARYLVLAGDRSFDLDRNGAEILYRRALELLPEGTAEHGHALFRLGEATQMASRYEVARDLLDEAARELEANEEARMAGSAYGVLGNVYFQLGRPDRMEEALSHALRLLEALPPGPELVEVYGRMAALTSMRAVSPKEALVWTEKAITIGEQLGARRELVRGFMWRGLMRCELGDLDGIADLEHALAESIELRTSLIIPAHVNLADQVWRQRGPAAALALFDQAIAYRVNRGGLAPTWPQAESCWVLYDLGRWDELRDLVRVIRTFEERHGAAQPGGIAQAYEVFVLLWRGLLDEARAVMDNELPLAREMEDPQVLGPALVAAALLATTEGDEESARCHVEEWRAVTRSRPFFRSQNLTEAVRIACALGDPDLAEQLLDNVVTMAERDRLSHLTARATIAQVRGQDARAAFAEAADGWLAFGCRFEHAIALREAGRETEAAVTLADLGVPPAAGYTAARTAK
jgi:class 3 adenylate cyclase/tetratricopeptide (TPR) repeat protein